MEVPMPKDLSEDAVAGWIRATFYAGQSPDRWVRIARAVRALVEATGEKVREACAKEMDARAAHYRDIADRLGKSYDGKDELPLAEANRCYVHVAEAEAGAVAVRSINVARVIDSSPPPPPPPPSPDCGTCFGCGYIPGTYERPTCDACGGTGKAAPRG